MKKIMLIGLIIFIFIGCEQNAPINVSQEDCDTCRISDTYSTPILNLLSDLDTIPTAKVLNEMKIDSVILIRYSLFPERFCYKVSVDSNKIVVDDLMSHKELKYLDYRENKTTEWANNLLIACHELYVDPRGKTGHTRQRAYIKLCVKMYSDNKIVYEDSGYYKLRADTRLNNLIYNLIKEFEDPDDDSEVCFFNNIPYGYFYDSLVRCNISYNAGENER